VILEILLMPTPQVPIGSGFGAASTAEDVIKGVDLTRKCVVVTGGYSGIGLETVRVFRRAGAKIFVPARDMAKAKEALRDMRDVVVETMDLLDPPSIDRFADRVLAETDALHILVNYAGVMTPPLTRDARG
jgi:NAD(P)-dependent dehydrogenase (short-subunit alcohol dehydrogenase family)